MHDDSNPFEVPPGNAPASDPAGSGATPSPGAVAGAGAGGAGAGVAGGGILVGPGGGALGRPPKPRKGPGRGNTWGFNEAAGQWVPVSKTDAPLDPAARKAVEAVGWGKTGEPAAPQEGGGGGAPVVAVPPVFVFDGDGNRAFLSYALNSCEGARKEHLAALALSILAGSKAESRADEFAARFYELEKLTEEEKEGVITVLLDFLRECEVNIPKSAIGVWAVLNRSWRGWRSQKEMVAELGKLREAAL